MSEHKLEPLSQLFLIIINWSLQFCSFWQGDIFSRMLILWPCNFDSTESQNAMAVVAVQWDYLGQKLNFYYSQHKGKFAN